jgi:WD40 repeat protein
MRIALDPSSAGFNAINTLLEGLEKTGRRRSWGLSNWPLTDITPRTAGTVLFNGRQTFSCRVDVRLLNENNKTISGGSITLNTEKIGFSQSGNALTIPRSVEGTVNFTNVKAEDLTPVLTIVIVAVNGIQADRINASGYMKVDTEDLEKRIRDREAAERERAAAAAQAERERAAAALAAAQWNVRGHSAWVYSVAFSPDGRQAISGSNDKTIKLWDVASGNLIRTFSGHSDAVFSVAFSPDGRQAISGSYDKTLKLWDVASGRVIRTFSGHTGYVRSVAFSPDGRQVISGSWDGRLKLWDIAGGSLIRTFSGHTDYVDSIAISPDGRQVISASYDGTLKLWDVVTGRLIRTFSHRHRNYGGYVIAFSPEEKQIILGSSDSLEMLDITSGSVIRIFSTYGICVAFSPDGRQVISNELKLWDVATGREIRTFWFSTFLVTSVAFSPDGKKVILGDETGYVRVWNVN